MEFRASAPVVEGRRPSGAYLPVPKPSKRRSVGLNLGGDQQSCSMIEPHVRINRIRDAVQAWRDAGYPGATVETMTLLEYWNDPDREGLKPYFCQRDAVETAIYLREADDAHRDGFNETLKEINAEHNESIPRLALKLATGTGKTLVMAMLILWQAKNGYCRDFVVFVPNLTIRDRLAELRSGSDLYNELRPSGDKTRFRVTVLNFQAWQQRTGVGVEGSITEAQKRVVGLDDRFREATTESEDEMIDRLLAAHRGREKLCLFNDEAHHCYNGSRAQGTRMEGSAKEETQAMMWFGALDTLNQRGRVEQVYDLSATPMWLRRPTAKEPSVLFPWTVSDFPLVDAIEAGLVKIPRVPIRDDADNDVPAFRNLHTAVKDILGKTPLPPKGSQLPQTLQDALRRMVADYNRVRTVYEPRGITPILIVVADTVDNAERLFAELGGWRRKNGAWVEGQFSILSNVTEAKQLKHPAPTLLVHSRMDETDKDNKLAGKASDSDNSAIHAFDEKLTSSERMQTIRDLFNTAGKSGQPGEHLRCIVSVGMLTEGWDATAVTHVVGYRHFGSDLLCEQVAGRALRRSVVSEPGAHLTTEYANIVGIPFLSMNSKEKGEPGEQKERWPVFTLPGRERRRMELPRVRAWRRDRPGQTARLTRRLTPFKLRPVADTGKVELAGEGGREVEFGARSQRAQPALWRLARKALERCKVGWDGTDEDVDASRLETFVSVVRATEEYLNRRRIDVRTLNTEETVAAVSAHIAENLLWAKSKERIVAVMDDPAEASTWDRDFETTLLRYPENESTTTRRSELNAAACHSDFERKVAALLERATGVDAWVRNYRIDWSIPWHDPLHGRWHQYEPDFVARVPREAGPPGHLVIEVKGRQDVRSDEKARAAIEWCRRLSDGAAPQFGGPWAYVMLDEPKTAASALRKAVAELSGKQQ